MLLACGFSSVRLREFLGGVMSLHIAQRDNEALKGKTPDAAALTEVRGMDRSFPEHS
jgi:hypothetical protein